MSENSPEAMAPFVSREAELQQLHEALGTVLTTKKPKFVLISGEFGMGKTTLVRHFLAQASTQHSSLLIGEGKCGPIGLMPFRSILSHLAEQGIRLRAGSGDLSDFFRNVAPAWSDVMTTHIIHENLRFDRESNPGDGTYISGNVNIEEGDFIGRDKVTINMLMHGAFSQEQVFTQFANALRQMMEQQPIIAFVEDLHLADTSSLHLLFHLSRYLEDGALLCLCTYRQVPMTTGANADIFNEIYTDLEEDELELNQGIDVAKYVAQRYPFTYPSFPRALISRVQKVTDGHALFVSQLFEFWEDEKTGVIISIPNPDGQPVRTLAQGTNINIPIPKRVDKLLQQRIRQIEQSLREVLACASVEGEDFTAQVIARVHQLDQARVFDKLATLAQQYRFIQAKGIKKVESTLLSLYRFAHPFFREHIYNHLDVSRRPLLHQQVGECLESLYKQDRQQIAGQLARHFHEAHEPLKAIKYALMAAQFEQSHYTWTEAEQWCEFGLTWIDELSSDTEAQVLRLDLLERSGEGFYNVGDYSLADQRYREALTLAQQLRTNVERIANLCERLIYTCDYENELDEAIQFLRQGKQVLLDDAVPFGELHLKLEVAQGLVHLRLGENDLAVQTLHKVLDDVEKLPPSDSLEQVKIDTYHILAISLDFLNNYAEAVTAYQSAIEIANRIGDQGQAADIALDLADNYISRGLLDESEVTISKALEINKRIGDLDGEIYAWSLRGSVLLDKGRPQEAIDELTRSIACGEKIGALWNMPVMHADLARAYLAVSNLEKAHQQAIQSVKEAKKTDNPADLGYTLNALAQVEVAQQKWKSAAQHFKQAISTSQPTGNRHFVADVQYQFAKALLQEGKFQEAIELLQIALVTFQELEVARDIAEAQRLLNTMGKLS